MVKRLPCVLLLAALAGCIEFEPISGAGASPGSSGRTVHVELNVTQSADVPDVVAVRAAVAGQPHALRLANDTLRVAGRAVLPVQSGNLHLYDALLAFEPAGSVPGRLAIHLPVALGVPFDPAAFHVPVVVRSGPARVTLPEGEELVLTVSPGAVPLEFDSVRNGSWRLEVRGGAQDHTVSGTGPPPSRFAVPATAAPRGAPDALAELRAFREFRRHTRGDSVTVAVATTSIVRWWVRRAPAAP